MVLRHATPGSYALSGVRAYLSGNSNCLSGNKHIGVRNGRHGFLQLLLIFVLQMKDNSSAAVFPILRYPHFCYSLGNEVALVSLNSL
jgi:hypothetical protein